MVGTNILITDKLLVEIVKMFNMYQVNQNVQKTYPLSNNNLQ